MLTGFDDDSEDQSGWLVALILWATGGVAGLLVAVTANAQTLSHYETIGLALCISLVSIALRLPAFVCNHAVPITLCHALWIFGVFAQLNWSGFLAVRSATGLIAAEGILVCLVAEVWFTSVLLRQSRLPWLAELRATCLRELQGDSSNRVRTTTIILPEQNSSSLLASAASSAKGLNENQNFEGADDDSEVLRITRDSVDANGERYLSGSIRFEMAETQKTETLVISFCPAMTGEVELELETNSDELSALVENCTESGARINVKRKQATKAEAYSLDWYARANSDAPVTKSAALP